jgi:hypothetical protein
MGDLMYLIFVIFVVYIGYYFSILWQLFYWFVIALLVMVGLYLLALAIYYIEFISEKEIPKIKKVLLLKREIKVMTRRKDIREKIFLIISLIKLEVIAFFFSLISFKFVDHIILKLFLSFYPSCILSIVVSLHFLSEETYAHFLDIKWTTIRRDINGKLMIRFVINLVLFIVLFLTLF